MRFDGTDVHANLGTFRGVLGYVPQDDIIHADLPLARTLRYAARLRLPSSTGAADVDNAVRDALDAVGLTDHADIRVGSLSGGQRKRASIAVELLTDPHVFFLDEPTSGLDPVTSAELIARLRQLADRSATVVFTTTPSTTSPCATASCSWRGAGEWASSAPSTRRSSEFRGRLGPGALPPPGRPDGHDPPRPARRRRTVPAPRTGPATRSRRPVASGFTQWGVLTQRTLEILVRNRLTLAILVGSPALVVAMFAVLFRPGAFDFQDPSPSSMVMIGFWVVFAAFFFGLTYGLLQICTERTILRRERLVGLRPGAYVASKVTHPRAVPPPRGRRHAGSAPPAGPPAQPSTVDLHLDRGSACCSAPSPPSASACSPPPSSGTSRRRRSPCRCCASPPSCSPVPSSR